MVSNTSKLDWGYQQHGLFLYLHKSNTYKVLGFLCGWAIRAKEILCIEISVANLSRFLVAFVSHCSWNSLKSFHVCPSQQICNACNANCISLNHITAQTHEQCALTLISWPLNSLSRLLPRKLIVRLLVNLFHGWDDRSVGRSNAWNDSGNLASRSEQIVI